VRHADGASLLLLHRSSTRRAPDPCVPRTTPARACSWLRPVLVSLPENVESWRETHNLGSGWSRLLR
jgi:hypothetical protein